MTFIFVHGGPGLNSNPERHIFKSIFGQYQQEILFWDEPSILRDSSFDPLRAYSNWLSSLKTSILTHTQQAPATIMAHSFGAFALNELLPEIQQSVEKLVLISPVSNQRTLEQHIFDLAGMTAPEDETGEDYLEALVSSLSRPNVLPSYWHNKEVANFYNQFFSDRYQLDLASFKSVRRTLINTTPKHTFEGPVDVFYGHHDPVVIAKEDAELIGSLYPRAQVTVMTGSAHYPHVEEQEEFFKRILGL